MDATSELNHFKLLSYMKKPKPWRNWSKGSIMSDKDKTQNLAQVCRWLLVNSAPNMLIKHQTPLHVNKKKRKRKVEPPFLIRNCISGHSLWGRYTQKMQEWAIKRKMEGHNTGTSLFSSPIHKMDQLSDSNNQSCSTSGITSTISAELLRSFYTIWHIGQISRKPLKTNEETEAALKELSHSPLVEKCLQVIPKNGISVERITDKSKLSKRALKTLSLWARTIEDVVEDGDESGYEGDPVELWNRAVMHVNASQMENDIFGINVTTDSSTTPSTASSCSNLDNTPRRRRSNRLLRAVSHKR